MKRVLTELRRIVYKAAEFMLALILSLTAVLNTSVCSAYAIAYNTRYPSFCKEYGVKLSETEKTVKSVTATVLKDNVNGELRNPGGMIFCWDCDKFSNNAVIGTSHVFTTNGEHCLNIFTGDEGYGSQYGLILFTLNNIDNTAPQMGKLTAKKNGAKWDVVLESCTDDKTEEKNIRYLCLTAKDAKAYRSGNKWNEDKLVSERSWGTQRSFSVVEGSYCIFAKDAVGNVSEKDFDAGHIDTAAPTIKSGPTLTNEGAVNGYAKSVLISVTGVDTGDGLSEYPYSFNGGKTWQKENTFRTDKNGSFTILIRDKNGNTSSGKTVTVSNIDSTAPQMGKLTAKKNGAKWDVVLESCTDDRTEEKNIRYLCLTAKDAKAYRSGNVWNENKLVSERSWGTQRSFSVTEGSYCIFAKDEVGNVTGREFDAGHIDTAAPTIKSGPTLTNEGAVNGYAKSVLISVTGEDAGDGLSEYPYSFNGGKTWQKENTYRTDVNGSFTILIRDRNGNTSSGKTVKVSNIDSTAPQIGKITAKANGAKWDVVLESCTDDRTEEKNIRYLWLTAKNAKAYRSGNAWNEKKLVSEGSWGTKRSFSVTEGSYCIFAKDAVGNVAERDFDAGHIDTAAPTIKSGPTLTDEGVVNGYAKSVLISVTGEDAGDGLSEYPYSFNNGKTWQKENTYRTDKNGSFTILIRDKNGNISSGKTVNVGNIDSTAPRIGRINAKINGAEWNIEVESCSDDKTEEESIQYLCMTKERSDGFRSGGTWDTAGLLKEEGWSSNKNFTVTEGSYCIFSKDSVGNISEKDFDGGHIDAEPPYFESEPELIKESEVNSHSKRCGIVVEGADTDGLAEYPYSFNNGRTWQKENSCLIEENGEVNIILKDGMGNLSETKTLGIDFIDSTPPRIGRINAEIIEGQWDIEIESCEDDITAEDGMRFACLTKEEAESCRLGGSWDENRLLSEAAWGAEKEFNLGEGSYCIFAADEVGNISEKDFDGGHIDNDPPYFVNEPSVTNEREANGYAKNVLIAVDAGDVDGLNEYPYSFNNGRTWQQENELKLNENTEVTILLKDMMGNLSEAKTLKINNIDSTAPRMGVINAEINGGQWDIGIDSCYDDTTPEERIRYTCIKKEDAEDFRSGGSWDEDRLLTEASWDTGRSFRINEGSYCLFARDEVGNVAEKDFDAAHIDMDPPYFADDPVLSNEGETGGFARAVVVSVEGIDDDALSDYPYSFNNGKTWQQGGEMRFVENGEVNVLVRDQMGNVSETRTVNIDNIDNEAPGLSVSGQDRTLDDGSVEIKVSAADNMSGVSEIAYQNDEIGVPVILSGGGSFVSGSMNTSVILTNNGSYTFMAKDLMGNTSYEKINVVKAVKTEYKEKQSDKNKDNDSSKDKNKDKNKDNNRDNNRDSNKSRETKVISFGDGSSDQSESSIDINNADSDKKIILRDDESNTDEDSGSDENPSYKINDYGVSRNGESYRRSVSTNSGGLKITAGEADETGYEDDDEYDTDAGSESTEIREVTLDEYLSSAPGEEAVEKEILPELIDEEENGSSEKSQRSGKIAMIILILLLLTALTVILLIRKGILSLPEDEEAEKDEEDEETGTLGFFDRIKRMFAKNDLT